MTCLIGVGPPGVRGMTAPRAWSGALLRCTWAVQRASCSWPGTLKVDSVPTIIEPEYWSGEVGALDSGSGWPGPLFGPAPRPLALVTSRWPARQATEVGYHPVGTSPETRPRARSTTATSLLPELATNSRRPV